MYFLSIVKNAFIGIGRNYKQGQHKKETRNQETSLPQRSKKYQKSLSQGTHFLKKADQFLKTTHHLTATTQFGN